MRVIANTINCETAAELMSPFIDFMVAPEEAEALRAHVSDCAPCARELQSFVALQGMVAGSQLPAVPEDLQLDTRVKLSRERLPNERDRWKARIDNVLKPLAVPALSGVSLTLMGFVVLWGVLTGPRPVRAAAPQNITMVAEDNRVVSTYEPPQTTTRTVRRFSRTMSPSMEQAISVQTDLSITGIVTDYQVIGGTRSPDVDKWLQEVLQLAQFRPATIWGSPVPSRVILSFVNVRG